MPPPERLLSGEFVFKGVTTVVILLVFESRILYHLAITKIGLTQFKIW
jgi:hypothetical protein